MDIKIPHSWLTDYLKTSAKPDVIAKYLSLTGPSVDRIEDVGGEKVYQIEITTNRIDCASVIGIAKEAVAALSANGIKAEFIAPKYKQPFKFSKNVTYLNANVDPKLCSRFTAILIKNVSLKESPEIIKKRLTLCGVRPINNIVDISNYIMHEYGQPVHTFDYDKIKGSWMILRESKRNEKVTTLDGITHVLPGGDIVIEDGDERLIDLAGIMGGENSCVDNHTKNVLLFVQTYDPYTIRRTTMSLSARTEASTIFEKGIDSELVEPAIHAGVDLFVKLTNGSVEKMALDLYPNKKQAKTVKLNKSKIDKLIGIDLDKQTIKSILTPLNIQSKWEGQTLSCKIPSLRSNDLQIPEDIIEEIARIYGYHKLPSKLMTGEIPKKPKGFFDFEKILRNLLIAMGGHETYTLSLVPKSWTANSSLALKNPLGDDTSHLRTSLMPSLINAANVNIGIFERFHIFEIANVYLPVKGRLPNEQSMLGGVFYKYDYRAAKGIIEEILMRLNITFVQKITEDEKYKNSTKINFIADGITIGSMGIVGKDLIYYELECLLLERLKKESAYSPIPKYPPQIEDLTFELPNGTKLGDLINKTSKINSNVSKFVLVDMYKNYYTFRITYQDHKKTLQNSEVEKIRTVISKFIEKEFAGRYKN